MIELGLRAAQVAKVLDALGETHKTRVRVEIRDRDEKVVGSLTAPSQDVRSGEVQIDTSADVTRQLSLIVLDPSRKLKLVPNSPAEAAIFADNFVSVRRGIFVEALDDWVDIPVFWGPVTRLERAGEEVRVEALGKESLLREPHLIWKTMRFRKGHKIVNAIREVLEACGETRFALPNLSGTLHHHVSIAKHQQAWNVVNRFAESLDRQIFYDGLGRARLRRVPQNNVSYVFKVGQTVVSEPQFTYDVSSVRNVVQVIGAKRQGKHPHHIHHIAKAAKHHPLSGQSLARNGKPRWMVEIVENEHIKRGPRAKRIAERMLQHLLAIEVTADFDALPVPMVEERDLLAVRGDDWRVEFHLTKATIPLGPEAPMSIGLLKHVVYAGKR